MNITDEFSDNIYTILCASLEEKQQKLKSNILRKHTLNLNKNGDYSFALEKNIWSKEIDENQLEQLLTKSQSWKMPIKNYSINQNRCFLYLDRITIMKYVLKEIDSSANNYGMYDSTLSPIKLSVEYVTPDGSEVTDYRLDLIKSTIENCIKYSKPDYSKSSKNINLTAKGNLKHENTITCGIVNDPSDKLEPKKISKMLTTNYIKKRSIDVQLLAIHKYGLRVKNENVFVELIDKLGRAASIVDLMEMKHSAPVGLATVPGLSSSKGATFILYNSARLETLFRTFDQRVAAGVYQELPDIDEVDFSLLKEEVST